MSPKSVSEAPSLLLPGTQVGDWRVEARQGEGTYGVVYRAVRVGQEDSGPVALKLAVYPWDPRFAREVGLLARIRSPSVPRLLGHGLWRHASGAEHPFFVMEWVEGTPLYAWAEQHAASCRQVLRLLAQVARALAATHAANAVHRDVKGANVLVRHSDGSAVLIDFGAGHFQGAPRLTWQSLPPGTVAYRSPEASLFLLASVRARDAYYPATPADDLFALGVTAHRLVTGEYLPDMEPSQDEAESWHLLCPDPRPFLVRNPRVPPRLRKGILRLLSESPEARGTAVEFAEALEAAAEQAGPEADLPLLTAQAPQTLPLPREQALAPVSTREIPPQEKAPSGLAPIPKRSGFRTHVLARRPWLALATLGMIGGLVWSLKAVHARFERLAARGQQSSASEVPDAGTAAVGDSAPTAPLASIHVPSKTEAMARDMPPKPLPGQTRPDEKGHCPGRKQVALNGGCWVETLPMTAEECAENGSVYSQGRCYAPALTPPSKPPPTSSPPDSR
ncbi:serine/threonine-protein kinase [Hyalangium rubrum]|uniref:Serine/threonine-protein kinase n=1 Tax=Hyalangium rubrum TaxID=3103134 RepID=A0ABU5H118_9BACT|nr:serine/threonine-protein kinase [Hyalangium sp. s54d21]MDY7227147.1 serine/threonine-protein kinase [Hyalangium sp. s54d21]